MEEDPFYSLEKTIKYSYRGLYLGAITGGVLSYLESEANNATLDTLLGIAAGGLLGIILGLGLRNYSKD